jgi:Niemann-Pick C1 protein
LQDEIKRQSHSDVLTIVISYVFMFAYIAFALGQYHVENGNLCTLLVGRFTLRVQLNPNNVQVNSKFMLGVAGVTIVALSVTSSIGVYAWSGIPATMIILEVQPFLVLAVGVDNIFIFVQAYQVRIYIRRMWRRKWL